MYEKLFRPAVRQGHKVFRNEHGQVVLADWSGTTPDKTEDGPLIVNPQEAILLDVHREELVAIIPVVIERSTQKACGNDESGAKPGYPPFACLSCCYRR